MSNRSYTFHTVPPPNWHIPVNPADAKGDYNYRFFLIQSPITSSIFLAYWIPPVGPESTLLPSVGNLIKVAGDPRTFKIQFSQKGTDSDAGGLDYYVEVVTPTNPESDPLYDYEAISFQKIF